MAVDNLPVLFNGDSSELVGRITLSANVEDLLKNNLGFIISAIIMEKDGIPTIVGLNLSPIPVEEKWGVV